VLQGSLDGLNGRDTWGSVQHDLAYGLPGVDGSRSGGSLCLIPVASTLRDDRDVEARRNPRFSGDKLPQRGHRRRRQGRIGQGNRWRHPARRAMSGEDGPTSQPGKVFTGQIELDLAFLLQRAAVGVLPGIDQIAAVDGTRWRGWEGIQRRLKNLGCRSHSLGRSALGAACHPIRDCQGPLGEQLTYRAVLGSAGSGG
jgi:hypothetical protein